LRRLSAALLVDSTRLA
jgi:hypothetical protein